MAEFESDYVLNHAVISRCSPREAIARDSPRSRSVTCPLPSPVRHLADAHTTAFCPHTRVRLSY